MCQLDYRFDSLKSATIFNGSVILPAKLIITVDQPEKGHWKEKLSFFESFISDVLLN